MTSPGSESVSAIRHLIAAAAERGLYLDEGPTAGLPAVDTRVPLEHAHALWERAVRSLGPALPLLVAGTPSEHITALHFAAVSCGTIGRALQLTADRWHYLTEAYPAALVHCGGAVHLRIHARGPLPLGARLALEYRLALLALAGHRLTDGAWRPAELLLGHRPPLSLAAWEAVCGAPVRVAPEGPAMVVAEATLSQPVHVGLSRAASRACLEPLEPAAPPLRAPRVARRVAEALRRDLSGAAPTVEQIAGELALSARSLHRQLAAEGTSYQRVLDGLRRDEAIRLSLDEQRPFKAIAAAVGFSDPRCFRRAFKRWTGTTPQAFRLRGLSL